MDHPLAQITVDYALILQVSLGFFWGILWAAFIQFNRWGQFLAERRTWITVVIGIGIDLLIAYSGDWWLVTLVISASSLGIIFRSLWNESTGQNPNPSSYKLKHHLEDITAIVDTIITRLTKFLKAGPSGAQAAEISQILAQAHLIREHVIDARNGR